MYITITLQSDVPWEIPVNYNHLLQAAIYRHLSPEFADFLHNQGYIVDRRRFTLFSFSRLMGPHDYIPASKMLVFQNKVQLILSSPIERFIREITQVLLMEGIRIGSHCLRVTSIQTEIFKVDRSVIEIETLSPVVAYSTLLRPDGRKYTKYFYPGEKDFQRIISDNLVRKAKLIYGANLAFAPVSINSIGDFRKQIVLYKNTIIEAYNGRFILEGDSRLLQAAVDAGLGGKNSCGFGCIRPISR
ncbi:CRISPR-associated endoribonuclease Cas6 [Geobacillus proteiniphilus]|nr:MULTISPECIES: CRISPR-associated endoribonuclease Cas6 [Geobacillus]OPX04213.1 CRISPR-associated endoribonuclease Cas6 [Geobacillus sp. LEMMY01]WMJ15913.1 CRISPR-associated endoribonuclease Cas6 [Geobacillus proteiniphilus]